MSDHFEAAMARLGFDVRVEIRDGLAVLTPRSDAVITTDAQRRSVVALASEHGFTHVALELVD